MGARNHSVFVVLGKRGVSFSVVIEQNEEKPTKDFFVAFPPGEDSGSSARRLTSIAPAASPVASSEETLGRFYGRRRVLLSQVLLTGAALKC